MVNHTLGDYFPPGCWYGDRSLLARGILRRELPAEAHAQHPGYRQPAERRDSNAACGRGLDDVEMATRSRREPGGQREHGYSQ